MRGVATEAGFSTGALTHYFADKRELLLATLRASLLLRRERKPVSSHDAPRDALRAALVAALPLDEDSRRHWMVTVAFCAEAAGDPELADAQRDAYRQFRSGIASLVERVGCDGPGGRAGSTALRTAERLIAMTDGVALQALFDPLSWPAGRQFEALDAALADLGEPLDCELGVAT